MSSSQLPQIFGSVVSLGTLDARGRQIAKYQYVAPTAGSTVTISNDVRSVIINPAGTLNTLTIAFPSAPADGQIISISSTQAVTTLTVSGATFGNASSLGSSLSAGDSFRLIYNDSVGKWFKC